MNIDFKLYNNDGVTLRYNFPLVQETNAPLTEKKFTELEGIRGEGSIVIVGSESAKDITIRGLITGDDYEEITTKIDALETALVFGTAYYLKIDKVEGGASTYSYKVRRLQPIRYSPCLREGYGSQEYNIVLRANSW